MDTHGYDSLRAVVADRLRDEIIAGRFAPGHRLREDDLAAEYGASRLPVREALAQLKAEGFVSLTRFRGAAVATLRPETGLELVEIRRTLEALAAAKAAETRGGECAEELAEMVQRGLDLVARNSYQELPTLVGRFHQLVAQASGNVELAEMLAQVRYKTSWVFQMDLAERSEISWQEHAEILSAVLNGFPSVAAQLMDRHVARDASVYMDRIAAGVIR